MLIKNSIKQSEILELLAKTRGGNAEQITRALYNETGINKLTQTYELLNKLIQKQYAQYFYYKTEDKQKRFYYLSKKGLNLFQEHYNIIEREKRTGLFGDFGYFTHALYKPKQLQIKHLLMIVDVMIDVYLIKQHTALKIDFAHNLYCATKSIKPDFVIQVESDKYFVEVDRMNERGIALNKKFEKYNRYFKSLKEQTAKIKGIYFVVPTPKNNQLTHFNEKQQVRYKSVIKAYFQECEDYKKDIDLCFVTTNEFSDALRENLKLNQPRNLKLRDYLLNSIYKVSFDENYTYYIYYRCFNGLVINIVTEIKYRSTKIWFDLLSLQEKNSIPYEIENALAVVNYKHVPDITVFTNKDNLESVISNKNYLEMLTPNEIIHKIPKFEINFE